MTIVGFLPCHKVYIGPCHQHSQPIKEYVSLRPLGHFKPWSRRWNKVFIPNKRTRRRSRRTLPEPIIIMRPNRKRNPESKNRNCHKHIHPSEVTQQLKNHPLHVVERHNLGAQLTDLAVGRGGCICTEIRCRRAVVCTRCIITAACGWQI